MVRKTLLGALMLSASVASSARAQDFSPPALPDFSAAKPIVEEVASPELPIVTPTTPVEVTAVPVSTTVAPAPVRTASNSVSAAGCPSCPAGNGATVNGSTVVEGGYIPGGGYPKLNAPLYPSPTQGGQPWSGGSIITNQALAPHEMLYPHKYHAMYGPFYYKVHGKWCMTPFGMRQHEQWELQGTQVKVNYRSTYAPFSGFHPLWTH